MQLSLSSHTCSLIFLIYIFALIYDINYIYSPGRTSYGGRFKFLTFWNLLAQAVYFGLRTVGEFTKNLRVNKFCDYFLAAIAFPLGSFVQIAFWTLFAIDRELIMPKHMDKIIPTWFNHCLHTTILPFLLIDMFLTDHYYPRRASGMKASFLLGISYLLWVFWIYYQTNFWVYPVLQVLGWFHRLVFILTASSVLAALYLLGEWTQARICRQTRKRLREARIVKID